MFHHVHHHYPPLFADRFFVAGCVLLGGVLLSVVVLFLTIEDTHVAF